MATATSEKAALESANDIAMADRLRDGTKQVLTEIRRLIVGQDEVIDQALTALFAGGHCLIVGVPGLAKTLLINTMAKALDLRFARIQFTPDLMPSDITGTDIIQEDANTGARRMAFTPGPVFTNLLLADEINRTPPKTQSALLEAMQEKRVTVQGKTYELGEPFHVFATQNPIEQEGTYPLPEAQLDRFMFQLNMDYLNEDEEVNVVRSTTALVKPSFSHALSASDIVGFQQLVRKVPVSEAVARYATALTRTTRPSNTNAPDFIRKWVAFGASPRAAQNLVLGGKARALMHGRYHVSYEDIRAIAYPVFRHRILLNFHAMSEKVTTDSIIEMLLKQVPMPRSGM